MRCAGGVTWARRAVLFNVLFAWFGYSGVVYLAAHPDVLPPAGADLLGSFQVTVSAQTPAAVLSSPRTCGQHVPLCSIALVRGKQTIMDIFSRLRPSQQASQCSDAKQQVSITVTPSSSLLRKMLQAPHRSGLGRPASAKNQHVLRCSPAPLWQPPARRLGDPSKGLSQALPLLRLGSQTGLAAVPACGRNKKKGG